MHKIAINWNKLTVTKHDRNKYKYISGPAWLKVIGRNVKKGHRKYGKTVIYPLFKC